jgi:hypothetical protein
MTGQTSAIETARKDGLEVTFGVLASTKIYKGTLVYARGGYVFSADGVTNTLQAGDIFVGVAKESVDNSSGASAALSIEIITGGTFLLKFSDTMAATDNGAPVYQDNTTTDTQVTKTANSAAVQSSVGLITQFVDTSHCYVRINTSIGSTAAAGVSTNKNYKVSYNFTVQGGAIATIALPVSVPTGVIIFDGVLDVLTALAGASGATAALQVEGANDVISASTVTTAPWSSTGQKNILPLGSSANSIKTTATRTVSLVVGTATVSAGKFDLYLRAL